MALSLEMSTLSAVQRSKADAYQADAIERASRKTAWRIEATLREFPPFDPIDLWFDYPVHRLDKTGELKSIQVDDGQSHKSWKQQQADKGRETTDAYIQVIEDLMSDSEDGTVHYEEIAEAMGKDPDTVRRDLSDAKRRHKKRIEHAGYQYIHGSLIKTSGGKSGQADGQV